MRTPSWIARSAAASLHQDIDVAELRVVGGDSLAYDDSDHGDMQVPRLLWGFVVQCLGSETVALYVIGALEPEPRARADAHADRCPACRRLIAELARASAGERVDAIDPVSSPRVHGRYRLREVLGAGAMGIVWRAHDPELGREVAIKILRGRSNGPSLLDEARAMAAVEDANVVRVYDVGSLDGQVYVAMELLRGGTLRDWHATTRPSWSELAIVMRQAALGLVAVHAAGLVHRDFKPENVLIGPQGPPQRMRVLVADFGLATALVHDDTDEPGEREASVRTPMLVGTPAYMAPELLAGGAPSPAGDQFAWCVTFCELLAGRRPHTRAITLPNGLPRRLARVLARGLRADPEQRWPSMAALVRALDRVLDPPRVGAWALGLGALVAIAGAGYGFERAPEASCDLPERAPVLDDARRQAIGASLERVRPTMPPAVAAVVDRLERWIPSWAEQAQQACEMRASDPQRFTTMRGCLIDRGGELDALVGALATGDDATVDAAAQHVLVMAAPDCRDADGSSSVPDHARAELAELRALVWTARHHDAIAKAEQLLAEDVPDPSYRAEVLGLLGGAKFGAGDLNGSIDALQHAVLAARAAGADELEAHAGVTLVMLLADTGRTDETDDWVRHLDAAAERVPSAVTRAEVDYAIGAIAHRRRDMPTARRRYERALATLEHALGPDNVAARDPLDALGRLELDEGHPDRARALLERALAIAESVWGLDHPETATVATNLAPLLIASGESARARMLLEQALAGQARLLGASHPSLSMTHMQLGLVALNDGDIGGGIAELEQCVAGRRADPPTATGAICRLNLAQARLLVGGCAAALPELRGVAQEFTALQKGSEHDREIAIALLTEAGCEIDSDPRKADAALARVEEIVPAVADPTMVAETKLMRAHIRWTRGEHDEARAIARAARAALDTPGATDPEIIAMGASEQSLIRRIDEWLAEH